jgi:hypothetical protein
VKKPKSNEAEEKKMKMKKEMGTIARSHVAVFARGRCPPDHVKPPASLSQFKQL